MATKKSSKKKNIKKKIVLNDDIKNYLYAVIIILISIIAILKTGLVGNFIYNCVYYLVGNMAIITLILIIVGVIYFLVKNFEKRAIAINYKYLIIGLIFYVTILMVMTSFDTRSNTMTVFNEYLSDSVKHFNHQLNSGGGLLGALFFGLMTAGFDRIGTFLILILVNLVCITLLLSTDYRNQIKANIIKRANESKRERDKARLAQKEAKRIEKITYDDTSEEDMEDFNEFVDESVDYHKDDSVFIDLDPFPEKNEVSEEKEIDNNSIKEVSETELTIDSSRPIYEDGMDYKLPNISLLAQPKKLVKNPNQAYAQEAGKRLIHILKQFGVNATLIATHIGPTVTKFEIRPEVGVRVNKISNLEQDIKMGLAAKDIRIEAPIPGKSTVGIEIPNREKTTVTVSEVLSEVNKTDEKLLFALGKGLTGEAICGELDKMPHMLIAGATGSGKSVCVNSIIISILMRATPSEVKLLLIDPKKVEFTPFRELPHLLGPVITDAEEASRALKVVVELMDKRYDIFSKVGVRNISGYNTYLKKHPEEVLKPMPYIAVIIDELADLMLVAAKDVEASIQRITQLARAAGIHLIVATQRPSVDVITGLIKANIPSRIAFAVSSAVDSRTILDQQGAEQLLGYGDMLYLPRGENSPERIQGCFVSDDEVNAIASYCASQAKPKYEDIFVRLDQVDRSSGKNNTCSDPIYEDVKKFVIENGKASTSFIQRKFSLGYARAARLIDMLEENGIIGPSNGSKPREVYVSKKIYEDDEEAA